MLAFIHLAVLHSDSSTGISIGCMLSITSAKHNKTRWLVFLDKEQTSYDDLLDALRISLKGYEIE